MSNAVFIRQALAADAETIARLHAASWRVAYRGIFSDAYLDGPIDEERIGTWQRRFADPGNMIVLIAEAGGRAAGFVAWRAHADDRWGGLIDNFHVAPSEKGRGIGRQLFAAVAARSQAEAPGEGLFLYVLEENAAARAAYERLGGKPVERLLKPEPDGREHVVLRYAWDPADLPPVR